MDPTYIIDFQAASGNFGPYDLVYLIPTWLTPAQRQAQQREMRERTDEGARPGGVQFARWIAEVLLGGCGRSSGNLIPVGWIPHDGSAGSGVRTNVRL